MRASVTDQFVANEKIGSANVTTEFWCSLISSGPVAGEMRPIGEQSARGHTPHGTGRRLRWLDVDELVRDWRSV